MLFTFMGFAQGREKHLRERRACVGQTPSGCLCGISRCKMDTPRLNREGTVSYQAEDLFMVSGQRPAASCTTDITETIAASLAFAITAHAAQGQTLEAAIVDLQIGRGTSPIAGYVALTRVKRREDLLIYRAFDRDLFTKGSPRGP